MDPLVKEAVSQYEKTDFLKRRKGGDPHSNALEPDCLFPFACDYDTVSKHREKALAFIRFDTRIARLAIF
jgi:hypothetical protein